MQPVPTETLLERALHQHGFKPPQPRPLVPRAPHIQALGFGHMRLQRVRLRWELSVIPCRLLHLTAEYTHPCEARPITPCSAAASCVTPAAQSTCVSQLNCNTSARLWGRPYRAKCPVTFRNGSGKTKNADSSKVLHSTLSGGGRAGSPQAAKRSTACTETHAMSNQGIDRRAGFSRTSRRSTLACPKAAKAIEGFVGDSWRYQSDGRRSTDDLMLSGTAALRDDSSVEACRTRKGHATATCTASTLNCMLTFATAFRSGPAWRSCPIEERTRSIGSSTVSHASLTSRPVNAPPAAGPSGPASAATRCPRLS
eukprot:604832-Pleurochrysis_carterae.AAC.2